MMRNALLALGAIVVVAAGFIATFAMWKNLDEARALAIGIPYTEFNFKTAHAQERGCNACHADHLDKDVSRLVVARVKPSQHGIFKRGYDVPMRVEDCFICHGKSFAASMHSRHLHVASFTNMGGNCDSCHTMVSGKIVLYNDQSRYDVVNGVNYTPTPAFAAQSSESLIRDLESVAKAN
ncbi:MAG: hypothetical protein K9G60_03980 [Pseudolabrys sp.]|nr:hypothetical protein [Pseudolabrys sp.]